MCELLLSISKTHPYMQINTSGCERQRMNARWWEDLLRNHVQGRLCANKKMFSSFAHSLVGGRCVVADAAVQGKHGCISLYRCQRAAGYRANICMQYIKGASRVKYSTTDGADRGSHAPHWRQENREQDLDDFWSWNHFDAQCVMWFVENILPPAVSIPGSTWQVKLLWSWRF